MLKKIYATIFPLIVILASIVCLEACSPVYKTNYVYHPVQAESKRTCANDCITHKQTCRSQCLDLERQCQRDANMLGVASEIIQVQADTSWSAKRQSMLEDCRLHLEKCEASCEENHKLCHENCGGEVTTQTVCVKNCKNL